MFDAFAKLLNMSLSASVLVFAIILFRLLFKKSSKRIICFLWILVAIRLMCPVSIESHILKISDYAETINQKIRFRLFWLTIVALIGMIAFVIIEASGLDTPGSVYEKIASAGIGLDFGMLIVLAMYLSGLLGKVKAERAMKDKNKHYTRVFQMAFGALCCFVGIVFLLSQINKTSGYIWLGCGCTIIVYSNGKYYFNRK